MRSFRIIFMSLLFSSALAQANVCQQAKHLNLVGEVEIATEEAGRVNLVGTVSYRIEPAPYSNRGMKLMIDGRDVIPTSPVFIGSDGSSLVVGNDKSGLCLLVYVEANLNTFPMMAFVRSVSPTEVNAGLGGTSYISFKLK